VLISGDSQLHLSDFKPDSRAAWARLALALVIGSLGNVGMWSVVVVLPTIQADFSTTRADASLAFTCTMLGFGLGGVCMGKLSDRFGIVPAIGIGTIGLGFGYIGAGYSTALWQFNLMHFAIGIGAAATFGPLMAEASHWFERYRGVAVTIAASGNYIAGVIWPPIVERGIAYAGWRASIIMAIVLLTLRWQIGHESVRVHANAEAPRVDLRLSANALTVILGLAAIGCCVAMAMPQVHIVAYCGDLGYGVARGAEMLSAMLAFGIISRIGSGLLADRIGGLRTLMMGSIAQGVALLFYVFFDSLTSLYIISAMFGLFQGGIVPCYAIIVGESMPPGEAATRVGIVVFASVLGMSLGGWISGLIFDITGSYAAAFLNGLAWNALNMAIVAVLLLRGRRRIAFA
jgi:MFS family permease